MNKKKIRLHNHSWSGSARTMQDQRAWRRDIATGDYIAGTRVYFRGSTHKPGSLQYFYDAQEDMQRILGRDKFGRPLKQNSRKKLRGGSRRWRECATKLKLLEEPLREYYRRLGAHMASDSCNGQDRWTQEKLEIFLKEVETEKFLVGRNGVQCDMNTLRFLDYKRFGHSRDDDGVARAFRHWTDDWSSDFCVRKRELCHPTAYGVCDSPEQILNLPQIRNDPGILVHLTHIAKDPENAGKGGGWRWHKWGPYIGDGHPQHEYLDDEESFTDGVYLFHLHKL